MSLILKAGKMVNLNKSLSRVSHLKVAVFHKYSQIDVMIILHQIRAAIMAMWSVNLFQQIPKYI